MSLQLLEVFCDDARHLVCRPYSVTSLHRAAEFLNINRCWYHSKPYPHYDIPKRRIAEITKECIRVSSKDILRIIKGTYK